MLTHEEMTIDQVNKRAAAILGKAAPVAPNEGPGRELVKNTRL